MCFLPSPQTLKGFLGPSCIEGEEEAEAACYDVKLLFGPLLSSSSNSSGKGGASDIPVTEVMVQGRLEVMIIPDLAALPPDFNEVEFRCIRSSYHAVHLLHRYSILHI